MWPGWPAAETRYRQADAPCELVAPGNGGVRLAFPPEAPQWAVTPGQSAVLYDGEVCLGGGVIASAEGVPQAGARVEAAAEAAAR